MVKIISYFILVKSKYMPLGPAVTKNNALILVAWPRSFFTHHFTRSLSNYNYVFTYKEA